MGVEAHAVMRDDAGGFLAAMLQGVQPQGSNGGGIRDIPDAEDTTFFMGLVIINQDCGSVCSE
jgi:hypothetical protein